MKVVNMAKKMTKTQKKRALEAIKSKAFKLFGCDVFTIKDYEKIRAAIMAGDKRIR